MGGNDANGNPVETGGPCGTKCCNRALEQCLNFAGKDVCCGIDTEPCADKLPGSEPYCCGAGEKCAQGTISGSTCCLQEQEACPSAFGVECCNTGQGEQCINGKCESCPQGQQMCPDLLGTAFACCQANQICSASGICECIGPECGIGCCGMAEQCKDPNTNPPVCCMPDLNGYIGPVCGDKCCMLGQTCTETVDGASECCNALSVTDTNQCCPGSTIWCDGECKDAGACEPESSSTSCCDDVNQDGCSCYRNPPVTGDLYCEDSRSLDGLTIHCTTTPPEQ